MPATVIVGGQFGSEGKGKVTALTAASTNVTCVVRCGGPNSGHTTCVAGKDTILRQLPASVGVSPAILAIAAGAVIDEDVLLREIELCGVSKKRLIIDPRAAIVTEQDKALEISLQASIGSTGSGNGNALASRIMRRGLTAYDRRDALGRFATIEPTAHFLRAQLKRGAEIVVEGTQGFGLSLFHGENYPFVTSKDTTASAFCSEAGISPFDVNKIILVVRTFPIRVGGNSGPLNEEVGWQDVQELSNADSVYEERTSVTNRVRRVGRFDIELVKRACNYNLPTSIAVMGLDRLDVRNVHAERFGELTSESREFLRKIEEATGVSVGWIGNGFHTFEAFHQEEFAVGECIRAE